MSKNFQKAILVLLMAGLLSWAIYTPFGIMKQHEDTSLAVFDGWVKASKSELLSAVLVKASRPEELAECLSKYVANLSKYETLQNRLPGDYRAAFPAYAAACMDLSGYLKEHATDGATAAFVRPVIVAVVDSQRSAPADLPIELAHKLLAVKSAEAELNAVASKHGIKTS